MSCRTLPLAVGVGLSTIAMYAVSAAGTARPAGAAPTAAPAGVAGIEAATSAQILHLSALTLPTSASLADVGVGVSTGAVDASATPRATARAANLGAGLLGLDLGDLLAAAEQSAPPDHRTAAEERSIAGTVPGVLSLGVSTSTAQARWTGDAACPAPGTALTTSQVSTADLATAAIPTAGSLLQVPGTVATAQRTLLEATGQAGVRRVRSTAAGSAADVRLFDGAIRIAVGDSPALTATASGKAGGADVTWDAPLVTVKVGSQERTLPVDGSPLDLTVPDNPLLHARLALGRPENVVEAADGTRASASASVLHVSLSVGVGAAAVGVLDADLFPLEAAAAAPVGGVDCGTGAEDADGDGLTDAEETSGAANDAFGNSPTDPRSADTDGDGLSDGDEVTGATNDAFGNAPTDPTRADTDRDGLSDGQETSGSANGAFGSAPTDPGDPDTDSDWLLDGREVRSTHTDPTDDDTDSGSVADGAEVARGSDPLDPTDDVLGGGVPDPDDLDGDGLANAAEVAGGTSPVDADTDGDGLTDGQEVRSYHTSATDADTDGDGLSDGQEVRTYRTKALRADTDGDGLSDGREVRGTHTRPLRADTDGDGLKDGAEVTRYRTNPLRKDTDRDGLTDGREVRRFHTKPLRKDTDRDGLTDGREVHHPSKLYPRCATNPRRKDTDRDGLRDRAEIARYRTNPCDRDTDNGGVNDGREVRAGSDPRDIRSGPGDVRRHRR